MSLNHNHNNVTMFPCNNPEDAKLDEKKVAGMNQRPLGQRANALPLDHAGDILGRGVRTTH